LKNIAVISLTDLSEKAEPPLSATNDGPSLHRSNSSSARPARASFNIWGSMAAEKWGRPTLAHRLGSEPPKVLERNDAHIGIAPWGPIVRRPFHQMIAAVHGQAWMKTRNRRVRGK